MRNFVNPKSIDEFISCNKKEDTILFLLSACPYCNAFKPEFESFAKNNRDNYNYAEVILDDYDNPLWERLKIDVVPTIIIFKDGKISKRIDGKAGVGLAANDLTTI